MKQTLLQTPGRLSVFLVLCALSLLTLPAFAQSSLDFTLHNQTGFTINEVYIAPSESAEWDEDVMGADALINDDDVDISFSPGGEAEMWDLKVVYTNGVEAYWTGLVLTEISDVTLFYHDGKTEATTE